MLIGVIADTHGLVRPEVIAAFKDVSLILHAGDVGGAGVLQALRTIAPVQAVIGNVDDPADPSLETRVTRVVDGHTLHVSHGHELDKPTPARMLAAYHADVLVFGHTHRAVIERAGARLVINPGAAGPRRFDIKPSVARLVISAQRAEVEIVWL